MKNFSNSLFFTTVFIIAQIHFTVSAQTRKDMTRFASPLNIPLYLAGNYGEIRSTHFHSGIDIKTEQVEGKMVLAADSGYVFRIVVQSGGYGHAVYMRHPDGRVTVYGHLSQFVPAIDKWVRDQQYSHKSFEEDLSVDANQFVFRKGDLIAYSGNTGSSGGPHLHFEIRDPSASVPFNVLKYGIPVMDRTKPRINRIAVYPLDDSSTVNGIHRKSVFHVSGGNGNYTVNPKIIISGNIGFGIETFDYLDNSPNQCSPYAISLFKDNQLYTRFVLDSIPFSVSGCVKSHIDYEEKLKTRKTIQKLFIDANNPLPIYKVAINRGVIRFSDTLEHQMKVEVLDANDNLASLNFKVSSSPVMDPPASLPVDPDVAGHFRYDSLNVFETADVRVVIPQDALFTNINFRYSCEKTDSIGLSDIYNIHQEYTPLREPYILSVKPRNLPEKLQPKAMLVSRDQNGIVSSQGGSYRNGFVTAKMKAFGRFYVSVDTLDPVIIPVNFVPHRKYNEGQAISFRIYDRQSGIQKYTGYIDNKWALFEYDAKNDLLSYRMDKSRVETGKMHKFEIVVTDNKDNISHLQDDFYF